MTDDNLYEELVDASGLYTCSDSGLVSSYCGGGVLGCNEG